ncbi:MAG: mycofactocin biosynthesis glycosyltransferase MftF [Acidimicrobiales bacterium]
MSGTPVCTGTAPERDPRRWRHLGLRLVLDASVKVVKPGRSRSGSRRSSSETGTADDTLTLLGGHPSRLLRLTAAGAAALDRLGARPPVDDAEAALAERLVAAGMAHPRPAGGVGDGVHPRPAGGVGDGVHPRPAVTVVVPARDRPELLERCLSSLDGTAPVVVVDDGSDDPDAIAAACATHGARLLARATPGGPAAARNDGIALVETELVAFVDSDCVVPPRWLDRLTWLFADPCIGAVAPRVRPVPQAKPKRTVDRYGAFRSPLDLGDEEGRVGPTERVRYVPTAALVVRTVAIGDGFDLGLQVGEDVDLLWRLVDAGWEVRYVPGVVVHHHEPSSPWALLRRRARYGTSAAPLARRHPRLLPLAEVALLPATTVVVAFAGHPLAALATQMTSTLNALRQARSLGFGPLTAARWSLTTTLWTGVGISRAATVGAGPLLVAGAILGRHPWRAAALALLTLAPLVEWWQRRPPLDPVRWSVLAVADDLAYGLGVWRGCLRERIFGPLVPVVRTARRA